jgi:hypothetical protein
MMIYACHSACTWSRPLFPLYSLCPFMLAARVVAVSMMMCCCVKSFDTWSTTSIFVLYTEEKRKSLFKVGILALSNRQKNEKWVGVIWHVLTEKNWALSYSSLTRRKMMMMMVRGHMKISKVQDQFALFFYQNITVIINDENQMIQKAEKKNFFDR